MGVEPGLSPWPEKTQIDSVLRVADGKSGSNRGK
jgi:hypothetical protein